MNEKPHKWEWPLAAFITATIVIGGMLTGRDIYHKRKERGLSNDDTTTR